jgi:putative peptidoglycan lipid II flippase
LRNQISRMIRLVCFLFMPLTLWVVMNALPLIRMFYERGQFHVSDSIVTARVLMLYGIGILPNALAVILLRCFYAVQDTMTPLWAESIDLVFYVVAALLLTPRFGLAGLAITRGMTFFLVASILILVLSRKRKLLLVDFDLFRFLGRTATASLAMAAVSWMSFHVLQSAFDSGKTPLRLGIICAVLAVSALVFLGVARLLKLDEATHIVSTVWQLVPGLANSASEST